MPKMRQLIAAATVLAGITFADTARANEITNIASAAEEITLTSGQITVGNPGIVYLPETATFLKEVQAEEEAAKKAAEEAAKAAAAAAEAARIAEENKVIMPLANPTLTSDYGEVRNLILQDGRVYTDVHSGVDYVNGNPNADIVAYKKGTVVSAGVAADGASHVIIKHDGHYSIYWHLAHGSIKVAVGDTVKAGQVIGTIGTTGNSTGIHLHFGISIRNQGDTVNPHDYLPD